MTTRTMDPPLGLAPARIVDKEGLDVQVLSVDANPDRVIAFHEPGNAASGPDGIVLTPAMGTPLAPADPRYDCTASYVSFVQSRFLPDALDAPPFISNRLVLGLGDEASSYCKVVLITTLCPVEVLEQPSFGGIGFYFRDAIYTIPKHRMTLDGAPRTLGDGRSVMVHVFADYGFCWTGSVSGSEAQWIEFKPFCYFLDSAANVQYRVWERLPLNHRVGRPRGSGIAAPVYSWDRSRDLIAAPSL